MTSEGVSRDSSPIVWRDSKGGGRYSLSMESKAKGKKERWLNDNGSWHERDDRHVKRRRKTGYSSPALLLF